MDIRTAIIQAQKTGQNIKRPLGHFKYKELSLQDNLILENNKLFEPLLNDLLAKDWQLADNSYDSNKHHKNSIYQAALDYNFSHIGIYETSVPNSIIIPTNSPTKTIICSASVPLAKGFWHPDTNLLTATDWKAKWS